MFEANQSASDLKTGRNDRGYQDSWPEKNKQLEDQEIICAERMVNDFRMYASHIRACLEQERRAINKLPENDKKLLGDPRSHWRKVAECSMVNQRILENALSFAKIAFGEEHAISQALKIHQPRASSDDRMSKIRSLLKQMVRDWSSEGVQERESCYSRVKKGLQERYSDPATRHEVHVLIPGCGLSRLAFDICQLGFSSLANEFDFSMITMANYILNSRLKDNDLTIYPYIVEKLNSWSLNDQIRPVSLPDINLSTPICATRKNSFSFAMGDFLEVFSDGEQFDSVVSVFFLDTAKNPIAYIRAMYNLLKPGGIWFNFGPLLYHFADMPENESVELPYDKLLEIIEKIGFKIEKNEGPGVHRAFYTRNSKSMMSYYYDCAYFECRKV